MISIVCLVVTEQEMKAGCFQNMLTLPCRRKAVLSKFTLLVFSGLFSCLLSTNLFGTLFSFIGNIKISFGFFIFVPVVLWASNILLYALQLILTFQFGRNLGVSIGVIGSLLAALMQTGLGTGLWYVVPYGLGVHFTESILEYVIMSTTTISNETRIGIAFCVVATCGIIGIMTFWFSRYSGTYTE